MTVLRCPDCDVEWGRREFAPTDPHCWMCGEPSGVKLGVPKVDLCRTCGGILNEHSRQFCEPRRPGWVDLIEP